MPTAKQIVRDLLDTLPDDCTLEEISFHLYLQAKMERLRDLDEGGTVPRDRVVRRTVWQWLRDRLG